MSRPSQARSGSRRDTAARSIQRSSARYTGGGSRAVNLTFRGMIRWTRKAPTSTLLSPTHTLTPSAHRCRTGRACPGFRRKDGGGRILVLHGLFGCRKKHRNNGNATTTDRWRLILGVLFISRAAIDPTSDPGSAASYFGIATICPSPNMSRDHVLCHA
jgi:hypothetical protein